MFDRVILFFKGLRSEYNKIIFPSFDSIVRDSIIVILCSFFIGLLIFVFDNVITFGFGFVFG